MDDPDRLFLLFRVGAHDCALPARHVVETLRPLPVEAWPAAPKHVLGLALIRGRPTPVVDTAAMLGSPPETPTRFVTLRVGDRQVALAVASVAGVQPLREDLLLPLPPLMRESATGVVAAIAVADAQLWLVLERMRLVPEGHDAPAGSDVRG